MRKRSEAGTTTGPILPGEPNVFDHTLAAEQERARATERNPTLRHEPQGVDFERMANENAASRELAQEVGVVAVTWGEEKFSPVQYNTFTVGPLVLNVIVRPGETIADASARGHAELAKAADRIRREKTIAFLQSLREVAEEANSR